MTGPGRRRRAIEVSELFVPVPHRLLADRRVSDAACRLWGVLYQLAWNDEPPTIERLQSLMATAGPLDEQPRVEVTRRSVYRWLAQLERTDWLRWHRNERDIDDRFELMVSGRAQAPELQVKHEIRRIMAGAHSLDDLLGRLRRLLGDDGDDQANDGAPVDDQVDDRERVTPESQTVTSLSHPAPAFDRPVTPESQTVTYMSHSVTSESHCVTPMSQNGSADRVLMPQTAPHENHEKRENHETPTPTAHGADSVGGEGPTAGELFLIEQGFNPTSAARWGMFPVEVLQTEIERFRANGLRNGGIVRAWERRPPQLPRPAAAPTTTDESITPLHYAAAVELLGEGADADELTLAAGGFRDGLDRGSVAELIDDSRRWAERRRARFEAMRQIGGENV